MEDALKHVPGAVNIPLGELETRLAKLDPSQEFVAYCRGPYCVLSYGGGRRLSRALLQGASPAGWITTMEGGGTPGDYSRAQ